MTVQYSAPGSHDSQTPATPMRDATRYLAAAGYLDASFRDTALRELISNRRRGVAPSHGGVDVVAVFFRDIVAAPFRLARMGRQWLRDRLVDQDPTIYTAYDYGARISLREYGAEDTISDDIQYLDAFKYTKLVEERLTEAVLDLLEGKGVDTATYRQQAIAVSMSSTTHYNVGTFYNSQFGGTRSTFTQNVVPGRQGGR